MIKSFISKRLRNLLSPPVQYIEKQRVLSSLALAKFNHSRETLGKLAEAEFSAFSQWGEDGIIDWLVSRLPHIPQTFVEFGVEDFRESNTRLLVYLRNWRGLIMDGSSGHISDIKRQEIYWRHDLTAKCAFIDSSNINFLIEDAGLTGDVGLLSIDIDGNDYWVWQAINVISPVIVVCEYNAVLGDLKQLTIPYQADFKRTQAHHSNLYFGASLPALVGLARDKGYVFVGTTSTGCNAFFVRNDFAPMVLNALENVVAFPSAVRESRDEDGQLTFVSGKDRGKLIQDLLLIDIETDLPIMLKNCGEIYSSEWTRGIEKKWQVPNAGPGLSF